MNHKKTLILLPGMLCDEQLWEKQMAYFSNKYHVVIGDVTKEDSIEKMATSILESAPEKFVLAGLSLGGIVSLEMVNQAPTRIEKLLLFDTNPYLPNDKQIQNWHHFKALTEEKEFEKITQDYLLPNLVFKHTQNMDNQIMDMSRNVGEDALLNQLKSLEFRQDYYKTLSKIKNDTHIIVGEKDEVCPVSFSKAMNRQIEHSTLDVISDAGHLVTMEQPEAVIKVMKKYI